MSDPIRVQLRRTKGWRMPPHTVSVARPTKWGNPFRVVRTGNYWRVVHGNQRLSRWPSFELARAEAVALFAQTFDGDGRQWFREKIRAELAGKNLACWCPQKSLCHADVLLAIANRKAGEK